MCHNPDEATQWKCRVLVGVEHEEKDQGTVCNVEKLTDQELVNSAKKLTEKKPFQFNFFAGYLN